MRELVRASRRFLFGSVCLASVRSIKRAQLQLYRVGLAVLTLYCDRIFKTITNRDWNWRKIIQFSVQSDSLQCEIKTVCFSVNLKPYRWVLSAFFYNYKQVLVLFTKVWIVYGIGDLCWEKEKNPQIKYWAWPFVELATRWKIVPISAIHLTAKINGCITAFWQISWQKCAPTNPKSYFTHFTFSAES